MQSSPFLYYLVCLSLKHLFQHRILERRQPVFLPQYKKPVCIATRNNITVFTDLPTQNKCSRELAHFQNRYLVYNNEYFNDALSCIYVIGLSPHCRHHSLYYALLFSLNRRTRQQFLAFMSIFSSLYRARLFLRPLLSSSETKLMFLSCYIVAGRASLQLSLSEQNSLQLDI